MCVSFEYVCWQRDKICAGYVCYMCVFIICVEHLLVMALCAKRVDNLCVGCLLVVCWLFVGRVCETPGRLLSIFPYSPRGAQSPVCTKRPLTHAAKL